MTPSKHLGGLLPRLARHILITWFSCLSMLFPPLVSALTIRASSGAHGKIVPSGNINNLSAGQQLDFSFTPAGARFEATNVILDGASLGKPASNHYTLDVGSSSHTLKVMFGVKRFAVHTQVEGSGRFTPPGDINIVYGSSKTFKAIPQNGFYGAIFLDGVKANVGKLNRPVKFKLRAVKSDHHLTAMFTQNGEFPETISVPADNNPAPTPTPVPTPSPTPAPTPTPTPTPPPPPKTAPQPTVTLQGQPLSYGIFKATVPNSLTITADPNDNYYDLGKDGCHIYLMPPVSATGDLDNQALDVLGTVFGSRGYNVVGIISQNPLDDYYHTRGYTADGWPFVDLQAALRNAATNAPTSLNVRVFIAQINNQVAVMFGWQDLNSTNKCLYNEVLNVYEWSAIVYSLRFPGTQSPDPEALKKQLVNGWFGADTGHQYINLAWQLVLSGNGRYSDLFGVQQWKALPDPNYVLETFSTWHGDGEWGAQENLLTLWPDDPSKPAKTEYFRIWDERNTAEPSGWRRYLRTLTTCGNEQSLCETWYVPANSL